MRGVNAIMKHKLLKRILILFLLTAILCVVISMKIFAYPEKSIFKRQGSQWVSDDGNISFSVFREMWYWSDDGTIDTERYIGFGEMKINGENVNISCLCDDNEIRIYQSGYSVNYQAKQPIIDIRLSVKTVSGTEVIATIQHIFAGEDFFSAGQKIRFTQTNNASDAELSAYEFFVDAYQIVDALESDSEIDVYSSIDELTQINQNSD